LLLHGPALIISAGSAEGFVSGRDSDNGKEGENQAGRAANVPPPEYDAQILGVPREEHLWDEKGVC
jgi:hypothetical protein